MTKEFNANFEEKNRVLKNMCANFFAKIDDASDKCNKKVTDLDHSNSHMKAMFINPEKRLEAKIFSI